MEFFKKLEEITDSSCFPNLILEEQKKKEKKKKEKEQNTPIT